MMAKPISPAVHLAMGMHSQPGVYAVLLGSGVSTGAGMPTGWGVVKDLVRQIAVATSPPDEESVALATADPDRWWAEHGSGNLGYSALLEELAITPAARQGLLAGFFEPTDTEREEGLKAPSAAHRALAELVKRGTVKVIITTNFDRLMEQALDAVGVAPQVISRPDAVHGMAPLAHAPATVIKLHGDYKDLGTLNTPDELKAYASEWDLLLSQVFDEYGLLIAGWSADWDSALVAAIDSAPSRRYPLYWDHRSSKGASAKQLLSNRRGQVIPAENADSLFKDLLGSVEALDRLAEPPLTTSMTITRLKQYLPDPTRRIDLNDLVMGLVDDVTEAVGAQSTVVSGLDGAAFQELFDGYLATSAPLLQVLAVGAWHDPGGEHDQLWVDVLQRLIDSGTAPLMSAQEVLDRARLFPALFATMVLGIVAAQRGRETLFVRAMSEVEGRRAMGGGGLIPAAQLLHPNRLIEDGWVHSMPRVERRWIYPTSRLLRDVMRSFFADTILLDESFAEAFHGCEYRLGLLQERQSGVPGWFRAVTGEYVGDAAWTYDDDPMPIAEVVFRKQSGSRPDWPWMDLLGGVEEVDATLRAHRKILAKHRKFR